MGESAYQDEPGGNPVLASIEPVVENAGWVFFHPERLESAVREWGSLLSERSSWEHPCHFHDGTERTVRWIFVLDVLNHCFWPDRGDPVWSVTYGEDACSGYWGLAACLMRAMEEGFSITDAPFLARLEARDLSWILRGEGSIPLFDERLGNLREAGLILEKEWGEDIVSLVETANGSAIRAVREVVSSFPSFRDQASYGGKTVYFWKRAQLFVSDLHSAFQGSRWGAFDDISLLTAFADYKLPQVMRELGLMSYHPDLARKIDSKVHLDAGGEEEVEIRAMTIHAVEELRKAFARTGKPISAAAVDNWLWQLGQLDAFRNRPYHRCRTIFY